jgi:hypothetical protein
MAVDCFECSIDRCSQCPGLQEPDDDPAWDADEDGWYQVTCCCGRWGESHQTHDAEYAELNRQLKPLQWPDASQPTADGSH